MIVSYLQLCQSANLPTLIPPWEPMCGDRPRRAAYGMIAGYA